MQYHLAIDIGASSGRHILGHLEDGKIILEEIHRFDNGMKMNDKELCWDTDALFNEILSGMKKCGEQNKIPYSVGIDTWGVDYVLLDNKNDKIGNTVGYRDKRTAGMDEKVYDIISEDELYKRTGIQKQIYNTIFQLKAMKEYKADQLENADSLLLIPDYFHFCLTGVKKTEYTNATTTGLVNAKTKNWDMELIEMLGLPKQIFQEIILPGTILSGLTDKIQKEVGYDCQVIVPATHDTASAVAAIPTSSPDALYISSGTWSLMGIEREKPDCSEKSRIHNFTNEGGYDYRFRYLKNIMGLWMIQSAKKEFTRSLAYSEICEMASNEKIKSIVDCNDGRFLAPKSMIKEIENYCMETGQDIPLSEGETAAVIYNSLAVCYGDTIKEIEEITGKKYDQINIVGGGSNADYLNILTAKQTQRTVYAGPVEATAIGNIIIQMIAGNVLNGLSEARDYIFKSFEIREFCE